MPWQPRHGAPPKNVVRHVSGSFLDYLARYTDSPFLIAVDGQGGAFTAGRLLTAAQVERYAGVENGGFKSLVRDEGEDAPRLPLGSVGFRWQQQKGEWNLQMKDGLDGAEIRPRLSFLERHDEICEIALPDFAGERTVRRGVPVRRLRTARGEVRLAALMARRAGNSLAATVTTPSTGSSSSRSCCRPSAASTSPSPCAGARSGTCTPPLPGCGRC